MEFLQPVEAVGINPVKYINLSNVFRNLKKKMI